jgi:hypothetical protein
MIAFASDPQITQTQNPDRSSQYPDLECGDLSPHPFFVVCVICVIRGSFTA